MKINDCHVTLSIFSQNGCEWVYGTNYQYTTESAVKIYEMAKAHPINCCQFSLYEIDNYV